MSDTALPASHEGGAPEWMVSYADMITIVMAFFVVLYATTSGSGKSDRGHEARKTEEHTGKEVGGGNQFKEVTPELQKVLNSLSDRFGSKWTATNCWLGGPAALRAAAARQNNRNSEKGRGAKGGAGGAGGEAPSEPGKFLLPNSRVFFDDASAALNAETKKTLTTVAEELAGKLQRVEIRGHTSPRPLPPDSPFRDHADLAYARCRSVEEFLTAAGVDARRIRLSVAAEREPLAAKGDSLRVERDARVEIRLLNEWVEDRATLGEETKQLASSPAVRGGS